MKLSSYRMVKARFYIVHGLARFFAKDQRVNVLVFAVMWSLSE